ncbi:GNAT family N-acetyltransferase [Streptomyces sp. NPDC047024]|uniref:GNAT family N-acetyltransferase n=1 Tax=Streptomyces sp. NPDC047024 TaxID=3155476 RepID=UPI0033E25CFB
MVTLRALTLDDVTAVRRICSGESVRYTHGYAFTLEQARAAVARILALTPATGWGFGIEAAGELVGIAKARRRTPSVASVSYILREDTWSNGYATDAVRQLVVILFAAGVELVEAKHHPANPASGRVLTKAGFVLTSDPDIPGGPGPTIAYPVYALRRTG